MLFITLKIHLWITTHHPKSGNSNLGIHQPRRETRGFAQALCAENDIKARASFMFQTDPNDVDVVRVIYMC